MSLFGHRKGKESQVSTLSEEEIQERLYGEFKKDPSFVAGTGEREGAAGSSSAAVKTHTVEAAPDLFTPPKETSEKIVRPDLSVVSREIKIPESLLKPSLSKPVERKFPTASSPSSPSPYPRYREMNKAAVSKTGRAQDVLGALKKAKAFFGGLFDPDRFLTRQVLYWTAGVFVVFFLFWSVNALNVRREEAMKTKHHAPSAAAPEVSQPAGTDGVREMSSSAGTQSTESVPEGVTIPATAKPRSFAPRSTAIPAASQPSGEGATPGGRFVIQVVMYPSEDYTTRVVASLKQAGFNAFVKESVRASGATLYAVLIGGFSTAAEAKRQLSKFRANEVSRPFSDAFVKTVE